VWHGVEKEPKRGVWILVQIGNDDFDTTIMEAEDNWEKLSMVMNIKRWAYVSDLMPDGKEDKDSNFIKLRIVPNLSSKKKSYFIQTHR